MNHPTVIDLIRCAIAVALIITGIGIVVHQWRGDTYRRNPLIGLMAVLSVLSLALTFGAGEPLSSVSLINVAALLFVGGVVLAIVIKW